MIERNLYVAPDDTTDQIHSGGYRKFVGGTDHHLWKSIGALQFDFLVSQGLLPHHKFLDIACGSLRAGRLLIPYLDASCYTGVDKFIELIIYGAALELGIKQFREKRPRFFINDTFEFSKLDRAPDYAVAQSLFTHLTPEDILLCMRNLRSAATGHCRFYVTFLKAWQTVDNPSKSHSALGFRYTQEQMESFGEEAGWSPRYIGDWRHPRDQMMMEYSC